MRGLGQILAQVLKSPTFATLGIFVSANMVATAVSGIGGIVQARWITPEILGQFQKYGILTSYLALGLVVVQDGLMRQYPYLIGRGLKDEAIAVAATAKVWYSVISIVFAALFVTLSTRALIKGDYFAAVGWGAQILVSIASSYGIYLQTIYRRSMEFKRLSYNGLISSFVGLALLSAVKFWGYYGLAIKVVVFNLVRVFLDAKHIPVRIKAKWNRQRFFDLAKISIPLSVEGYIRTSFMMATFGFLVVRYCGPKDLGLYGIAAAFEGFAMIFVSSLMQIFDVKMANNYGSNNSVKKGVKALLLPTSFGVASAIACAGLLCLVIGPFMRFFVPRYVEAIPVVYVLSLGLPVGAAMMPTRLLRVALLYKHIYSIAIVRVLTLVIAVQFVPKSIEWFAGCKIFAEFISVVCGYALLLLVIKKEST